MAKFRVLAGSHEEGTGEQKKVYVKGQLVSSSKALDKLFKNKFERIGAPTEEPNDNDNRLNTSGRQGDDPEHLKATRQPTRGIKATVRTAPKSAEYDPEYEAEVRAANTEDDEDEPKPKAKKSKGDLADPLPVPIADLGDDVTDQFPEAADAGLAVYKDATKKQFVLARDGVQVGEPVKNKTDVKKAIKAEAATAETGDEDADPDDE